MLAISIVVKYAQKKIHLLLLGRKRRSFIISHKLFTETAPQYFMLC